MTFAAAVWEGGIRDEKSAISKVRKQAQNWYRSPYA
jgi:hypothetical protein